MKTFRNKITKLHITNLEILNEWEFVSFYQQKTWPSEVLGKYENRDGVDNKKPNVSIIVSVIGIRMAISLMEQMEMDSE